MHPIYSIIHNAQAYFVENLLNSLTAQQKKIAAVAIAIFSAGILIYCISKFARAGLKSKISLNNDSNKEVKEGKEGKAGCGSDRLRLMCDVLPFKSDSDKKPLMMCVAPSLNEPDSDEKPPMMCMPMFNSPPTSHEVKVYVRNGAEDYAIDIPLINSVLALKARVYQQHGIAMDRQRLMFGGKILEDIKTLESYNLTKDAVIILALKPKSS